MTNPKLSDRELDAVIAEKVMGCRAFKRRSNAPFPADITAEVPGGWRVGVPPYSSSLDALAPVVERTIRAKGNSAWVRALESCVLGYDDVWRDPEIATVTSASPRQIAEAVVRCWE